jgi:hypothetical protein
MTENSIKRQYIMLKPMATGATGFARMEAQANRLFIQLTCKDLRYLAKGLRVFLYMGEGAAQEIGQASVNLQGQATLNADLDWQEFGLLPTRLQAILILSDDSDPKPLMIGLCSQQSAGSLMDAKNAMLAICDKLSESRKASAPEEPDPTPPLAKHSYAPKAKTAPEPAPKPNKPGPFQEQLVRQEIPKDPMPQEIFLPAIDLSTHRPKAKLRVVGPPSSPGKDGKSAPTTPPQNREDGAKPVDRLRPLIWPPRFRELPAYFTKYPPLALFDLPGWRFVRVPMADGGYFAIGYHAQDERVSRVAYALPGVATQPPPHPLNRYRFYYGRDGQGYWTLGQKVK